MVSYMTKNDAIAPQSGPSMISRILIAPILLATGCGIIFFATLMSAEFGRTAHTIALFPLYRLLTQTIPIVVFAIAWLIFSLTLISEALRLAFVAAIIYALSL